MAQTKLAGSWSYEDILSFPDDDRRYEIIEGDLYEMPSTDERPRGDDHQSHRIASACHRQDGKDRWFTAPLDVFIPEGTRFNQIFLGASGQ